jgi:hypothetical protein
MILMLSGVISSPRRRRRLAWIGGAIAVLGAAVAAIAAMPTGTPAPPERLTAAPTVRQEREVAITPAMRRAIDATLDTFVPAAVARRDPGAAWRLAGPGLRGDTSRSEWLTGELPVQPFPVGERRFHGWRAVSATRNRVALDLLLHPRKDARVGPIAVGVDLVRDGRRWLVDSFYTTAVFNAPDEPGWVAGQPDFGADGATADATYNRPKFAQSRLSAGWFLLPLGLIASGLLAGAAYVLVQARRSRRAYAEHQATLRERAAARG